MRLGARRVHHRVGDAFPWGDSSQWLALVTEGSTVRTYRTIADAGRGAGRASTLLALETEALRQRRRESLVESLESRLARRPPHGAICV